MTTQLTPKQRQYRNLIQSLTNRIGTCHINDVNKIQAELFRVKAEAVEYEKKLLVKRELK